MPLARDVIVGADPIAVVGATLIDGTGREPTRDSTVIIRDGRFAWCGPRDAAVIPPDANVLEAAGKFLIPGLVDTNAHLAPFIQAEALIRYHDQFAAIALETAQVMLKAGVTTVRDTYGPLMPLLETRDAINSGAVIGPRVLVAGNIVGWGGPGSTTFEQWGPSHRKPGGPDPLYPLSFFIETIQDEFTQGVGEELIDMEPPELASAIRAYLDKGVDFIKYGGTTHGVPALMLFSPRAQETIIDEVHRRGLTVDTHATSPEAVRISILAGVDVVQHPEAQDVALSHDLLELYGSRRPICSLSPAAYAGPRWLDYLRERNEHLAKRPDPPRPSTSAERTRERGWYARELWRANAIRLIELGCTISLSSDTSTLPPRGLWRAVEPRWAQAFSPGETTLRSVEGAVEIGMTPMDALVCATKHGALAANALDEYGTVEVGKSADLLVLDEDPLHDIHNIRRRSAMIVRGRIIDTSSLPTAPVYSA